jgi:MOSC domain-containing protein YiiM
LKQLTMEELKSGLDHIRQSPQDKGVIEMIVRRPRTDEREVMDEGILDLTEGLVGDKWMASGNSKTDDGKAHPEKQLNIMNSRVIALVAQEKERWPLAGDQLYIDLDLSFGNLPTGTQLSIGSAIIEVTSPPHNGCSKFSARFGRDANRFVNLPEERELRLRGINARVINPGIIKTGDIAIKL